MIKSFAHIDINIININININQSNIKLKYYKKESQIIIINSIKNAANAVI